MTDKSIKLSEPMSDNDTDRLNHFAGRYLSEHEFDLMQAYVAERCEDLLRTTAPGILHGLSVQVNHNDDDVDIVVKSGLAVTGSGTAVSVDSPIHLDIDQLKTAYKKRITEADQDPEPIHGYYFLTVKREVALLDEDDNVKPCDRNEPDPTRDSRLETIATLDLQFISAIPKWMSSSPRRAISNIFKRFLTESPFDQITNAVPLALMKFDGDVLQWVDPEVGCFQSGEHAVQANMSDWWAKVVSTFSLADAHSDEQSLAQILDCDYLPSSGAFPSSLVENIAGYEITESNITEEENPEDLGKWALPDLRFTPFDLEVEMVPVPDNSVQGTLKTEINRGVVNLAHYQKDRIRLMVAVDADDYRPDLFDLPQVSNDLLLEAQTRYEQATKDYHAWAEQYFELYAGLADQLSDEDEFSDFIKSNYIPENPSIWFDTFSSEQQEKLKKAIPIPAPANIKSYLPTLEGKGGQANRPYSQSTKIADGLENVTVDAFSPEDDAEGMYAKREALRKRIDDIQGFIDQSSDLLNEFKDFVVLQRQQLDNVTISFSFLAGGVPGDGKGLSILRRIDNLEYQSATPEPEQP